MTGSVTKQHQHLELGSSRRPVVAEQVKEAFQTAIWTEAVEKQPERPQEEVTETEAVKDVNPQLRQGPYSGLVEGTHQSYLGTGGVTQLVNTRSHTDCLCSSCVCCLSFFNGLFDQLFAKIRLLWTGTGRGHNGGQIGGLRGQM